MFFVFHLKLLHINVSTYPKMITDVVYLISSLQRTVRFLSTVDVVLKEYNNLLCMCVCVCVCVSINIYLQLYITTLKNPSGVNTIFISSFHYTHLVTSRKCSSKLNVMTDKGTAEIKSDTEHTMKLQQLCKICSECELN